MKRVHEPKEQIVPSRYKCDRCAEEFESKDAFKEHKLPELHYCELCKRRGEESSLPTKCELNFHIITHRTGKPKICDNCGSEFKNNKNLRNHIEADRRVSCRRCNMVFTGSCPLQRHIRDEHDLAREPLSAVGSSRTPDLSKVAKITLPWNFSVSSSSRQEIPFDSKISAPKSAAVTTQSTSGSNVAKNTMPANPQVTSIFSSADNAVDLKEELAQPNSKKAKINFPSTGNFVSLNDKRSEYVLPEVDLKKELAQPNSKRAKINSLENDRRSEYVLPEILPINYGPLTDVMEMLSPPGSASNESILGI